jgi:uncharacterized membrane protein (DUF2068 family)
MPAKKQSRDLWLFLIGLFKLVKGIACLIAGFGLIRLLHRDIGDTVMHWVNVLRVDPDNRYIHQALLKVFNITPNQLKELSVGSFVYAGIFLTEAAGLLTRKHWAEYMTLLSTALFLPLEFWEMHLHFTWVKLAVTVANLAIVWYLAARLKRHAG